MPENQPYSVQTLDPHRMWVMRRYQRLAAARTFARNETARLHLTLNVHRVDPDGTTWEDIREFGGGNHWRIVP